MNDPALRPDLDVEVSVIVAATPETLFRYLIDPERLGRWLGAVVASDPRPGGALRIDMAGQGAVLAGEVVEMVPNQRVVFTWGEESGAHVEQMPAGSTTVTIELHPVEGGTEVTLRHADIPGAPFREGALAGWRYYLGVSRASAPRSSLPPWSMTPSMPTCAPGESTTRTRARRCSSAAGRSRASTAIPTVWQTAALPSPP